MSFSGTPRSGSEWMVALNDAPGDEALRREHGLWLARSEDNRRDWDATLRMWRMMSMTVPAHGNVWGRSAIPAETRPMRPHASRRRPAFVAAALVAAALVLVALLPGLALKLEADHVTGTGEAASVGLADGSRLELAPGSAVAIDFDDGTRRMVLLRGEVYVAVAPETDRPFSIEAGGVAAVALGTRYAVGLEADATRVSVEEGVVRVDLPPGSADESSGEQTIRAGEEVAFDAQGVVTRREIAPSLVAAWRQGLLVAEHRPLGELVDALDRSFDGMIVVADRGLAAAPLTGIYSLSDPAAALEAMADTLDARVIALSPWILVLASR